MTCYFCNLNKDINIENKKQYNFDISKNYLIKGDNLDVLYAMQDVYKNKVKLIYIDPPYNTKTKRNYKDKFTHQEYLDFMYPRIALARELLRDDGIIFVSIDDNEQAQLKILMDGIFGSNNFIGQVVWEKCNSQSDATIIQDNHEYILCYTKTNLEKIYLKKEAIKNIEKDSNGNMYCKGSTLSTGGDGRTLNSRPNLGYSIYYNKDTGDFKPIADYDKELAKTCNDEKKVYSKCQKTIDLGYTEIIRPPKNGNDLGRWKWGIEKFEKEKKNLMISLNKKNNYIILIKEYIEYNEEHQKYYLKKEKNETIQSIIKEKSGNGTKDLKMLFGTTGIFSNSKSIKLIKHMLQIATKPEDDDIILDFFAGSGTTGHAVLEKNLEDKGNRKFILIQNDEKSIHKDYNTIFDVCNERLKRAYKQNNIEIDYEVL